MKTLLAALALTAAASSTAHAYQWGTAPKQQNGCQYFGNTPEANDGYDDTRLEEGDGSAAAMFEWAERAGGMTLNGGSELQNRISAVHVDQGCTLEVWSVSDFGGDVEHFGPGFYNLARQGDGWWNDRISSVDCRCVDPRTANSIAFDGTRNYADVKDGTYFEFGRSFTISAWVNPSEVRPWARVLDFGTGPMANEIVLVASNGTSGRPSFHIQNSGTSLASVVSPVAIPLNTWTHLAAVFVGTSNEMKLYVNGDLVASGQGVYPTEVVRTTNYLGKSLFAGEPLYKGSMADVRIVAKGMTDDQIRMLHAGAAYPTGTDLFDDAARWQFRNGASLLDASTYDRHGFWAQ